MLKKNKSQTILSIRSRLARGSYFAAAVMVVLMVIVAVNPVMADAYGQVANRSIQLSSTANGATNVAYNVNFTTVTNNQNMGSIVVLVCGNSPILGDSCTIPSGFSWNAGTSSLNNVSTNLTGLAIDTVNSTANKLVLTRGTASTFTNAAVTFTVGNGTTNGVTNATLTTSQTFYARIITYTSTNGSGNETTDPLDAGGIAMSLASQLNVTAKVQEALFFCVYTGTDCAAGGTGVTLGDENGVLASNVTTYTSTAKFSVSSNAVSGVSVRLKGTTLTSGAFTIDPHGASCTTDSIVSSVEQFGLRMQTLGAGVTPTAPYNCATGAHGFDANNATGTTSLFGQEIARTSGATDITESVIEFAAKSANTSEAGVYTTALTLIATATY